MANITKIRISGSTYTIVDESAVHSLAGYSTTAEMNAAITGATSALAESIAEQHYQTSGDVQNAISGKADTTAVTAVNDALTAHTADSSIHVSTAQTAAWNAKADISDLAGYADAVKYDTNSKEMKFYHGGTGGTEVFSFDASPFLIDGMVQNVEIKDVDIVQTFHTGYDANYNKQPYFTAANYNVGGKNAVADCTSLSIGYGDEAQISLGVINSEGVQTFPYGRYFYSGGTLPESEYVTASVSDKVFTFVPSEGYRISQLDIVNFSKGGEPRTGKLADLSVTAATTCLVISFNTDAGKQDINIPLTDIFDASNYYTKAETQDYVSGFTYDKNTIDTKIAQGGTFDPTQYYTTAQTYSQSEVNTLLGGKADTATTYTKTEVDTALSGKQATLVSGTNIKTVGGTTLLGSGNIATLHASLDGETLVLSES